MKGAPVENNAAGLSDLAELILAVGRLIQPPGDQAIGTCTPIESSVMRFIGRNPGTSARAAAEATLLTSSNFSRVLRGLEEKGLVSREPDASDARRVSLYPTTLASQSRRRLGEEWDRLLRGIEDDPDKIHHLTSTLRRIESELVSRRRRESAGRLAQD
jgi:DNA-binding MarR family transcriptional regulator